MPSSIEVRRTKTEAKRLYDIEYNKLNKEKRKLQHKEYKLAKHYGVTLDEYNTCMSTSDVCELCGTEESLCYDHCHDSMKFRGVLCSRCNSGIGFLGDTLEDLERAVKYLRK